MFHDETRFAEDKLATFKHVHVNWLIPTLQGVYPAGRNTLPAHKRECFPPISDSLPPSVGRAGLGNAKEYFCISLALRRQ